MTDNDKRWKIAFRQKSKEPNLIDRVSEGGSIEVVQEGMELKEGDALTKWIDRWDESTRRIVGKPIYILRIPVSKLLLRCEYCDTPMRRIIVQSKHTRQGRDGREYTKHWKRNDGAICPLCLAELTQGELEHKGAD